jgi:pimeloyl-ACP methyl ester carboxylesterase
MTMGAVEIDGLSVVYEWAGAGPPLVLLHGAISDARAWRRQLEALRDEFTIVAWDAPGAGRSAPVQQPFGMAEWADVLAGLLRALELGPAHVLGLSWGGSVALELYARHPEAVASLILADSYAGWKGSLPPDECAARLAMALETSAMPPDELAARWLPSLLSDGASPELADDVVAIIADFPPGGLRLMARAMADADLRAVLPTIRVPTLLLWGEHDVRSPLSVAEAMHAAIPGSRLVVIPDAGHESNLEQPERFNAAVRAFCGAQRRNE